MIDGSKGNDEWDQWVEHWTNELGYLGVCRKHMTVVTANIALGLVLLKTHWIHQILEKDLLELKSEGSQKILNTDSQAARLLRAAMALDYVREIARNKRYPKKLIQIRERIRNLFVRYEGYGELKPMKGVKVKDISLKL